MDGNIKETLLTIACMETENIFFKTVLFLLDSSKMILELIMES